MKLVFSKLPTGGHTPEPWFTGAVNLTENWLIGHQDEVSPAHTNCIAQLERCPEAKANAERIVACVNSCVGMDDPENDLSLLKMRLASKRAIDNDCIWLASKAARQDAIDALKNCLRAWAKGDSTGDFGTHPAVTNAKRVIEQFEGEAGAK